MKFILLSFAFAVTITAAGNSQVVTQWRSRYNGNANDTDIVKSIAIDAESNVYVTGYTSGSQTGKDFATVKYNSSGVQQWVSVYDHAQLDDVATKIIADADGNVYVTGYSTGSGTLYDYLTIKYSSQGNEIWTARFNGKGNDNDIAADMVLDGSGNVYVTGYSVGSTSSEDYVTIKYNADGVEQWTATYNNNDADDVDIATSIAFDSNGFIMVTGFSNGVTSQEDYATVKYDLSGNRIWARRYNGPANKYDIASGIVVDQSGNSYVTGYSMGEGTEEDYATVKYDANGDQLWANRYNGNDNSYDISTSIVLGNNEQVIVTGYSYDQTSSEDYATIKYSGAGDELWVRRYDGAGNDFDIATSVDIDIDGNIYVTGYSYEGVAEENYVTVKYEPEGTLQWVQSFNGDINGNDIAIDLVIDNSKDIYVAGYSDESPSNVDFVTLKYSQTTAVSQFSNQLSGGFNLSQNYPNPFNPATRIQFTISKTQHILLKVFNAKGAEVAVPVNKQLKAGSYELTFDGSNLPSGVYFYKLSGADFTETKRMLLIK